MLELTWQFSRHRLAQARQQAHLSQRQLALAIGKTTGAVRAYEQGRILPSLPVLLLFAEALDVTPNDLCLQDARRT